MSGQSPVPGGLIGSAGVEPGGTVFRTAEQRTMLHPPHHLADDERAILHHVAEAWRLWLELPCKHPDDLREFHAAVHQMQLLVSYRLACRVEPEVFGFPAKDESSPER